MARWEAKAGEEKKLPTATIATQVKLIPDRPPSPFPSAWGWRLPASFPVYLKGPAPTLPAFRGTPPPPPTPSVAGLQSPNPAISQVFRPDLLMSKRKLGCHLVQLGGWIGLPVSFRDAIYPLD